MAGTKDEDAVLAIDVGTTGVTSVLYSTSGERLSSSYSEFPIYHLQPGWVEQDAEDWWNTALLTVRETIGKGDASHKVKAIAVTNQRETVVPVGKDGKPISRALVWQDRRSAPQASVIHERLGREELFRITGLTSDPYFSMPKILWWKANEPEVFNKAWKFMLVHDYVVYKLCGEVVTDRSNGSRTMLMDLAKRTWSEKIASEFGIDLDKMPRLVSSGEVVEDTTQESTKELRLSSPALVVAGGGDQQCSALGLGVIGPGKVKSTTGTGTFVVAPVDKREQGGMGKILYSAHAVHGVDVAESSIFTTGSLLAWLKRILYPGEDYDTLNREAEDSGVGARGLLLLPFLSGSGAPHWNPDAKGALTGLTLAHGRGDIVRAAMEAVAFEVRSNLETFEELGIPVEELRLDGGAANSKLWNSIFAEVCGRRCLVAEDVEATATGAGILACNGLKVYGDLKSTMEAFTSPFQKVLPGSEREHQYSEIYNQYAKFRSDIAIL